ARALVNSCLARARMTLFDLPAAQVFARAPVARVSTSLADVVSERSKTARSSLKEGTHEFAALRNALLCHAEWALILAASNTQRSLELMRPVAAPWAHVTLYY